ncbi:MAG: hypothetical protein ABIN48_03760 [Ginsengibacter sp.]
MQAITLYDYFLLPFYLVIFYFIVRKKARKYKGTPLKHFFMLAFWLHMFGAFVFAMLMWYYYGYGDTFGYYQGGDFIRQEIIKDISSIKYLFYSGQDLYRTALSLGYVDRIPLTMPNDGNALVMKVSAVLSFFSFNQYLIISLFFGFIAFIGTWKLFYVMQELNGPSHLRLLGYATIATPSLWLWGSGLSKEPLCIGSLGMAVYLIHKMFIRKQFSFRDLLLLLLLFYFITVIKGYITGIFIISLLVVILYRFILTIKNIVLRIATMLAFVFIVFFSLLFIDTARYINEMILYSYTQIENFRSGYDSVEDLDGSKATFSIGDLNPTLSSLVLKSPEVIFSCLFRPFLWESRKVIIFFAGLEAFVVFLATLIILLRTKFLGFFYYVFNDPFRLFCFIYSMLFALLIGYTTFNFGTMVRYKILFLPFYLFLLVNILTAIDSKKKALPEEDVE